MQGDALTSFTLGALENPVTHCAETSKVLITKSFSDTMYPLVVGGALHTRESVQPFKVYVPDFLVQPMTEAVPNQPSAHLAVTEKLSISREFSLIT